ncbi:family 16 glycosylhydrolase [uncultured Rothia sp.]|uniref:glycoside hydrolase family 16 protein n=1 Tax=uncultured Rothia sp. TaxID=316088 RepID=UPI0028DBD617|nr:family 16 glycosylhydrolase [uncultured Rothia sp.]
MRRIARTSLLAATMAMTASAIAAPSAFAAPQSETAQSGAPAGYSLAFSDEFNGPALDTSKWGYQYSCFDTNKHTQAQYTDSTDNVSVSNGYLNLTARYSPTKPNGTPRTCKNGSETYDAPFTSGMISTKTSNGNVLYAAPSSGFYMESRIKLPKARSSWSSLWMTGVKGNWPSNGEIDIFESKGYDPNYLMSNTHTPRAGKPHSSEQHQRLMTGDTASSQDEFHTYGVLKTKDKIQFFLDGAPTHTVNMSDIKGDNPFLDEDNNLIIRLNHMVGGSYLANAANTADKTYVDATKFASDYDDVANSTMLVDYVRVYTPSSEDSEQPGSNDTTPEQPGTEDPGNTDNPATPETPGSGNGGTPTPTPGDNPGETPGDNGSAEPSQPEQPDTPGNPGNDGSSDNTSPANPDGGKPGDDANKPGSTPGDQPQSGGNGNSSPATPAPAPGNNGGAPGNGSTPAPSNGGKPSTGTGNNQGGNGASSNGSSTTPVQPSRRGNGNQGGPRRQGSWSSSKPTHLANTGSSSWGRPFAIAFRPLNHFWGWMTTWRFW